MNQNPEQTARDNIDKQLRACGWLIQDLKGISLQAGIGVAVREYPTEQGPADYILFVEGKPVGVIEAKREDLGFKLTTVEEQSGGYAVSKLKYLNNEPLPFIYESTGILTRFTDCRDPKPRAREVFSFHRPESLRDWLKSNASLPHRLQNLPQLDSQGFRDCQVKALANLDLSFKNNCPRALIQMATGAGKTFTAITAIYRLIKFAHVNRVLFLVDTKNLGEQAEQEFMAYLPNDDNRKFTELYNVQRLKSSYVATDSQVCISTIQRLYSILKGEELDESAEENNPAEARWDKREPLPVVYNPKLPIEFFDVIIIDECHRSIYNLWKQVLDYFDAFLIGLTATPDKRTFGFFNQNVVSEYTHEEAVADGVNVGYDVFIIETEISKKGSAIWQGEWVDRRERLSRKKRWEQLDENFTYTGKDLDRVVVNPSQIRAIIRTFKDRLPQIFPERKEVPKTLIFAKDDSHADDIIQIVREEFGEGNQFCKKVTYKAEEDPKSILAQFRNDYYPRVAVTVDMIATGTDVRPLECLVFMRDVKSKNYFEQMKGRGTRTITLDDLRKVTPSATYTKDHFVIIDAVGVTKSTKTDSRPLERKPSVPLKDLLTAVAVGARDEDLFTSLAGRLARLEQIMTAQEKQQFSEKAQGKSISQVVKNLLGAYDPDNIENKALTELAEPSDHLPGEAELAAAQEDLMKIAAAPFTGDLNAFIDNVRKIHEQVIDNINIDTLDFAGWDQEAKGKAAELAHEFAAYLETNKDEITALQIYYNQPYRRREITEKMIKDVLNLIKTDKPALAPLRVWKAYEQLDKIVGGSPKTELTALVALIRRITGLDQILTPYDKTVDRNFQDWIFKRHAGAGEKFTTEQMAWLHMMKDHIAISFHLDQEDFDYDPFNAQGGLGKAWQLFGDKTNEIIQVLNEVLVA